MHVVQCGLHNIKTVLVALAHHCVVVGSDRCIVILSSSSECHQLWRSVKRPFTLVSFLHRLLLATISAKQVKTRQMIASVTPPVTPNSGLQQQLLPLQQETDKQHQQLQLQLKAATDQLAVVKAELVAAASELAAARTAASQQAVLLQQRSHELQEMHDSLLRQESGYQAEVDALQERLLDAEGQLAKLSAVLPGGWRRGTNAVGAAAAGTPASMSMPGPARAADVAEANQSVSETGNPAVAAYGSPPKLALQLTPSLSLQTPDQAAAAQYKSWLRESQAALMAAQEDLMNQERQIKQLERQLQQMQQRHHHQEGPQQDQGQQEDTDDAVIARMPQHWQEEGQGPESLKPHSQQHILDLQAALDEAHSATQAAQAVADAMRSERDSLRVELSQLSQQVQSAVAARAEAVAALAAAQHAGELYRDQIQQLTSQVSTHGADEDAAARPDASDSSSDAAAAAVKTATAEAELLEARETAAAALAAVAELQQQLQQMQEQQREFGKQSVAAASVTDQQGHSQRQLAHVPAEQPVDQSEQQQQLQEQPEGSVEYQLLRATSVNQALQSELVDTKQRLLLLLQLIKRAATQAGRQQQLPAELAELADAACTAATQFVAADDGSTGGDDGAFDVACLLQVVSGLQQRYCCSQEHHQLLLRGKEMQFLLENALQQVHLIKAAGSDFGCSCPSEAEYQLLAGGLDDTAKQHTPAAAAVAPLPAVTAAADMPIVDQAHDNLLSGLEHFITAAPAALTYQMPGSCSNDALRDSAGYGAAGSRLGFAVADEGLGYDGLDGSWWATSTIGNTTAEDLPAFLLPKAE